MQVHQRSVDAPAAGTFPHVDERATEGVPEGDVVRAARPLEALRTATAHRPVAAAPTDATAAAGAGDGVSHPGRRERVHEGRLSRSWWGHTEQVIGNEVNLLVYFILVTNCNLKKSTFTCNGSTFEQYKM